VGGWNSFCRYLCPMYYNNLYLCLNPILVLEGSAAASYSASRRPGSLPLPSIALQTCRRTTYKALDPTSLQCDGGQRARPGAVGLHCACRGRAPPSQHILISLSLPFSSLGSSLSFLCAFPQLEHREQRLLRTHIDAATTSSTTAAPISRQLHTRVTDGDAKASQT
jgi:hypothetical protein